MTILTNDTRGQIVNNLLAHRFKKEAIEIAEAHAECACAVYIDVFGKNVVQKMKELSPGWLPEAPYIQIQLDDTKEVYQLRFNGNVSQIKNVLQYAGVARKVVTNPVPYNKFSQYCGTTVLKVYTLNDVWFNEIKSVDNCANDFLSRVEKARKEAAASLKGFTTIEKLLDAWPEVKDMVPAVPKTKPSLPSVPVAKLNEVFNLP